VATFATALAGCGGAVSSKDHSVISEVEGDGGWTADSPASEDGGNAPDAPYVYGTDCGAILYVPPVITVQLSSPSPAGCDATFSTYDPTSHTVGATIDATLCNGAPKDWGCPASTTEIPAGACVYALGGFEGTGSVSVLVSEPGYVPAQIDDVSGGSSKPS
jgi:hypothetical protein